MKPQINFKLVALLTIILIICSAQSYLHAVKDDVVTITGTVVAYSWDEDENVTDVAIVVPVVPEDHEEEEYNEEYLVGDTKKGKELLNLVDSTITATGKVETTDDGTLVIYVTEYKVLDDNEE
ncbi:hypothetical protein JW960_04595 [candidate division KSB1 bacterium]|nr:hypothetical protein [candidate division KSB1 bacterium]